MSEYIVDLLDRDGERIATEKGLSRSPQSILIPERLIRRAEVGMKIIVTIFDPIQSITRKYELEII